MRQLFVLDPLRQINPEKDSSAALMQAAYRAGDEVWVCTPSDLIARGEEPLAMATPVMPEPWITAGPSERLLLTGFDAIWMRKDPPVDEAYLYATHLLEVAEMSLFHVQIPSEVNLFRMVFGIESRFHQVF